MVFFLVDLLCLFIDQTLFSRVIYMFIVRTNIIYFEIRQKIFWLIYFIESIIYPNAGSFVFKKGPSTALQSMFHNT